MNVGWSTALTNLTGNVFYPPEHILNYLKQEVFTEKTELFLCPAFNDYIKNLYIIRSPLSFSIFYNKKEKRVTSSASDFFSYNNEILGSGMFNFVSFGLVLLCDEPLLIEALPAFFHSTTNKN